MNNQEIVNMALVQAIELPSDVQKIAELPSRVTWDVRLAEPLFETDFEIAEELSGGLVNATVMYACWTDEIGKPSCLGWGEKCPDHPDSSSPGIMLVLQTNELGLIYMSCFGLLSKWAIGLVKQAVKSEGDFSTKGRKAIKTKFGIMHIPGLDS